MTEHERVDLHAAAVIHDSDGQGVAEWYRVEAEPGISMGMGLTLPEIEFDFDDGTSAAVGDPIDVEPIPPDWHFCSKTCLAAWSGEQARAEREAS